MAELFTASGFFTLLMLLALQAVLGFDNLLYISIESKRVGEAKAPTVRRWGIGLAILFRIILLIVIVNLFSALAEPLFQIPLTGVVEGVFNLQSLVTLGGGAFIIYTAIKEIKHLMVVDHIEDTEGDKKKSVTQAVIMIVAMNVIFSFDSICFVTLTNWCFRAIWYFSSLCLRHGFIRYWISDGMVGLPAFKIVC